ncbi:MAG TPA: hypothetical protein VFM32_08260 [Spongiibacteraceae bacterium]|nr:hypothetical protein [Spongiibacteraceae bacterium]
MDIFGFFIESLPTLLGALGTWLLVREVDRAHKYEKLSHELREPEMLLILFQTNLREFWIRSAMISFKCDRSTAEEMSKKIGDDLLITAAKDYKDFWERDLAKNLDIWHEKYTPFVFRRRRQLLWTGFVLLMFSATFQIIQEIPKHINSIEKFHAGA